MRRQSRVFWAVNVWAPWALRVMSPWALGVGALVSFTAVAGQDPKSDWHVAPLAAREGKLAAPSVDTATRDFDVYAPKRALIQQARLAEGDPEDFRTIPDEREPHVDIKPDVSGFPEVDRTHKGDPVVAMRPTMDTRARTPRRPDAMRSAQPASVTPSPAEPRAAEIRADAPPKSEGPSTAQIERAINGATPSISRAVALSSVTPAQADATPIEVSSFTGPTLALGAPDKDGARPDYAALVDPDRLDREKRCLAEAVYFESRSEPEAGQAAVAQVVLNRVSSGLYPTNICGVVYQNRHRWHACQFSFACEGRSLRITERDAWERAVRVANEVMDGRTYISDVGRSTHYHANYVRPRWARALTKMDVIGRHVFYRLKPGQT